MSPPPDVQPLHLKTSGLAVEDRRFPAWWSQTHEALERMSLCDKPGEFSVTPVELGEANFERLQDMLPRLLSTARRVAIDSGLVVEWARPDQKGLVRAFLDAPRRPIIARPDGIFVDGRLQLLELNIDSGIGGYAEVDFVQRRFGALIGDAGRRSLLTPSASGSLPQLLKDLISSVGLPQCNLALIAYPHFRPYHALQVQALAERLTREVAGCTAHVVTANELRAGSDWIRDERREYHMLWRFGAMTHSEEAMRPVVDALLAARSTRTVVMSDPVDLGVEGKLVLALLSESVDEGRDLALGLSDQEVAMVRAHVPWTRFVAEGDMTFREHRAPIEKLLSDRQCDMVLKRGHSKSTQHVHLGSETGSDEWRRLVTEALRASGSWIVQENQGSPLLPFTFLDGSGELATRQSRFTFNPFVFGAACGAPLIRIERDPQRRKVAMAVSSAMALTGTVLRRADGGHA